MQAPRLLPSAAAMLLSAALLPAALAQDDTKPATRPQVSANANTAEQVRAEFRRAQAAGELAYGAQFQIEETLAFKTAKQDGGKPAASTAIAVAATQ